MAADEPPAAPDGEELATLGADPVVGEFVAHVQQQLSEGGDGGVLLDASPAPVAATDGAHRVVGWAADERSDDARELGGPSRVADAAVWVGGLDSLPPDDWAVALGRLRRGVRPGGLVYLTGAPDAPAERLAAALDAAGLAVVERQVSPAHTHWLCRAREVTKAREGASVRLLVVGVILFAAAGVGVLLVAGSFGPAGVVVAALLEAAAVALLWRVSPSS